MTENREETLAKALQAQFPVLAGQVRIQRARRLWLETPAGQFDAVFAGLVANHAFTMLCTITGVDEGESLGIIYHLAREDGLVANLKVKIPKALPKWKSIGEKFPGGIIYEREIADLLGVQFAGLPPGPRYPLPDNWPACQYPLRKDWQPSGGAPVAKEGE